MKQRTHKYKIMNLEKIKEIVNHTHLSSALKKKLILKQIMKKQCNECKRDFSEELIQNLASNVNGELKYTPMCPICALADRNATFGFPPDTPFNRPIAKALHKQALAEVEQMRREKK